MISIVHSDTFLGYRLSSEDLKISYRLSYQYLNIQFDTLTGLDISEDF